ncbi:MAG: peptidoglycan-binding protein [Clostridia bacterium]|nr:peptidoglycan-binding protein [Clostridia bacterium]
MRGKKILMLAGLLGLCLGLSGCYIAPDDINGQDAGRTDSGSLPFMTLAPTATVEVTPDTVAIETQHLYPTQQGGSIAVTNSGTQAPEPTPTPTQAGGSSGWSDWGTVSSGETPTPDPGWTETQPSDTSQGGGTVILTTRTPAPGSESAAVTSAPKATIQTVTAAPATPTPTPKSLQRGFTDSEEVRALQKRLKQLGWYTGAADGDFGPATEAAVKAFQRANGLTADGKAGQKTLEKLNSSSAISKKQAQATATPKPTKKATAAPRVTATPRPTATPNLSREYYLQLGASGQKVRTLQNRLIQLGWLGGRATGKYDAATEAAVRAFQKKTKGLWEDGVAGPDTLRALYSSNAARASGVAASTGETLELGSEGNAVRALQKRLKELGYLSGTVDGSYGAATEAAVRAFQQRNGLTSDGKAGTATLNKLYGSDAVSATASQANGEAASDSLRPGDTGQEVRKLQQALKRLGYYSGSVDGSYGVSTEDAVRAFQIQNRLTPVDGIAGKATRGVLYSSDAISASAAEVDYETVRLGDRGELVVEIQECLREEGYLDHITGVYDDATMEAVKAFQRKNGLNADGVAGGRTLEVLFGY